MAACFAALAVVCSAPTAFAYAESASGHYYTMQELDGLIAGIIGWKRAEARATSTRSLLEDKLAAYAGDFAADWYALSIARNEQEPDYPAYLDKLEKKVAALYADGSKETVPATELHRIALTMLALGGDPRNIASTAYPQGIDIIADFTYDRGLAAPLGKQGISGLLWGLITLDAMRYQVPAGSFYTRESIILQILESQKTDGGFALSGSTADPDLTAMAVQALSPYYNDVKKYKYTRLSDGIAMDNTVKVAIEAALARLSAMQKDTGDYSSWGSRNSQTGAQVMLSLCCLGIDPQKDSRFIKKGKTLMDGVMLYRMADGGFANSLQILKSNSKSTEQILYTFVAMRRQMAGMRTLFDIRPEQSGWPESLDSSEPASSGSPSSIAGPASSQSSGPDGSTGGSNNAFTSDGTDSSGSHPDTSTGSSSAPTASGSGSTSSRTDNSGSGGNGNNRHPAAAPLAIAAAAILLLSAAAGLAYRRHKGGQQR